MTTTTVFAPEEATMSRFDQALERVRAEDERREALREENRRWQRDVMREQDERFILRSERSVDQTVFLAMFSFRNPLKGNIPSYRRYEESQRRIQAVRNNHRTEEKR